MKALSQANQIYLHRNRTQSIVRNNGKVLINQSCFNDKVVLLYQKEKSNIDSLINNCQCPHDCETHYFYNYVSKSEGNIKLWEDVDSSLQNQLLNSISNYIVNDEPLLILEIEPLNNNSRFLVFTKNGIINCVPALMKNYVVKYNILCQSIIESQTESSNSLFSFRIDASGDFIRLYLSSSICILINSVREYLIREVDNCHKIWILTIRQLLDAINGKTNSQSYYETIKYSNALVEITEGLNKELYDSALRLNTICMILSKDIQLAQKVAEKYNFDDIIQLIDDYYCMLGDKHTELAKSYFNKGFYDKSLDNVKIAIDKHSNIEAWRLYANIIITTANINNLYNEEEFNQFKLALNVAKEEREVINKEFEGKILDLNRKRNDYKKGISQTYRIKIKENDMLFFKSHPELINKQDFYGMTPIMYAALYKNEKMFAYFEKTISDVKNCLNHSVIDILAFRYYKQTPEKKYFDFLFNSSDNEFLWFKYDSWIVSQKNQLHTKKKEEKNRLDTAFSVMDELATRVAKASINSFNHSDYNDDNWDIKAESAYRAANFLDNRDRRISEEAEVRHRKETTRQDNILSRVYSKYNNIYFKV